MQINLLKLIVLISFQLICLCLYAGGGHNHHVLVRPDGTMWSWGNNEFGQLGTGDFQAQTSPIEIGSGNVWRQVARGQFHNIAVDEFGRVWTWGLNKRGQLGTGDFVDRSTPTLLVDMKGYTKVTAGAYHSIALKKDGSIKAWGENNVGQLGDGTNLHSNSPVTILGINSVLDIAAGAQHTLAIKTDGTLWSWGSNGYGQLGTGGISSLSPMQVGVETDWTDINSSAFTSIALRTGGNMFLWGKNYHGQIGNNTTLNQSTPILVGQDIDEIDQGMAHTLMNSGAWGVHTAGSNTFNQLAYGVEKNNVLNMSAILQPSSGFTYIDAGEYHNVLESGNGEIYSFGRNNKGQAGVGYVSGSSPLTKIFGPMSRFKNKYSMKFDGVDDQLIMDYNYLYDRDEPFTMSTWFKTTDDTGVMMTAMTSSGWYGYRLNIQSGNVRAVYRSSTTSAIEVDTQETFNDNRWHLATVTYDGSSLASGVGIYIDGALVSTTTLSDNLTGSMNATWKFRMGGANSSNYFEGYMDEASMWDRVLTSNEVSEMFNDGTPMDLLTHSASSNLVGYWKMGEDDKQPIISNLVSPNDYGTMTNMSVNGIVPTFPSFNERAVKFDGVDDGIDLGNNYAFDSVEPFSISTWVKTSSNTSINTILRNMQSAPTYTGWLFHMESNGQILFGMNADYSGSDRLEVISSNGGYNNGAWHHLTVTYSGTKAASGINIYVNGSASPITVNADGLSGSIVSNEKLIIGNADNFTTNFFSGSLDETSIWDKELTVAEVTELYAGNTHLDLKKISMSENLIGWWRMGDGDTSPIIKDHSVSQNDGTMVNGPEIESLVPKPFKLLIDTALAGSSSTQFVLPLNPAESYNFTIDWGDGSSNIVTSSTNTYHNYNLSGSYLISIYENVDGGFPAVYFNNQGDKLKVLDLVSWGDVKWKTFNKAFLGCSNMDITATDYLTARTNEVTNFISAWSNCSSLTNFPQIDTSAGTSFDYAWQSCSSLTSFPLLNTANGVTFIGTWQFCSGLTSFPLIDTSSATNFFNTWKSCSSITNFPSINTVNVTNFTYTWQACSSLTSFPLIDTSSGTNFSYAWESCSGLTSFPLINTSNGATFSYAWRNCSNLTNFPLIDLLNGTNFTGSWQNCVSLTSFPLIDTSSATTIFQSWKGCTGLVSFPLIDTSSVTNFNASWNGCTGLSGYDFPLINMVNLTTATSMFTGVTLSTISYSDLIINLNASNSNPEVTFDGGNSQLTAEGDAAKLNLINTLAWTITDGGLAP